MSNARRFLPSYTVADYFRWEGDWELWDGIPVAMTPSLFGPHSQLVVRLLTSLQLAAEQASCDVTVLTELDWIVSENTVLRPDILIVCGGAPVEHLRDVPALVAEVLSPATLHRDCHQKRDLYASYGVQHYLLVDPIKRCLTILQLGSIGSYTELTCGDRLQLSLCKDCVLDVDLVRLFR